MHQIYSQTGSNIAGCRKLHNEETDRLHVYPDHVPPFPPLCFDPIPGHGFLLWSFTITLILHTTLGWTPLDESSAPTRRPLPDNIQHSQEKNMHASGGVRTRSPSESAVADPRLRPRGHLYRHRMLLRWSNKQRLD